jgi:hypothetical protein
MGSVSTLGVSARGASTLIAPRTHDIWRDEDPLTQIPETAPSPSSQAADDGMLQDDGSAATGTKSSIGGSSATFALWTAAGAIAGTGASWAMDGGTLTGLIAGSALGALAGWGWLRWTSPK